MITKVQPVLESICQNSAKCEYLKLSFEVCKEDIKYNYNLERIVELVYNINKEGKNRKLDKNTNLKLPRFT